MHNTKVGMHTAAQSSKVMQEKRHAERILPALKEWAKSDEGAKAFGSVFEVRCSRVI